MAGQKRVEDARERGHPRLALQNEGVDPRHKAGMTNRGYGRCCH